MAAAMSDVFSEWLSSTLFEINPDIDLKVFVSYIQGVLEDEEDDREESLSRFLGEVMDSEAVQPMCNEILRKWSEISQFNSSNSAEGTKTIDDKFVDLLEKHKVAETKVKVLTAEEKARKDAILAQYSQICDGEEEQDDDTPSGGDVLGFRNTNVESVDKDVQEARLKMKDAHDKKKEKDKMEREKQKQKKEDRKEAEKKRTQKGEKRR